MPTYSYECEACGHGFDMFQSMNDPNLTTCPQCHKERLRRLIGAGAGLIFKGSGFYQTDNRSPAYKKAAAADKKAQEKSQGGGESKSSEKKSKSESSSSD